jgi:hypothetical protein
MDFERQYTVRELRRVIKESQDTFKAKQEFEPKYGDGVEKGNKKVNRDAYKDVESDAKAYFDANGKVSKEDGRTVDSYVPYGRGMESLRIQNKTKKNIDDYNAQAEGYVNAQAKKEHENDPFGNAIHTKGFQKAMKNSTKVDSEGRKTAKEIGLTSRLTKFDDDSDKTMYESRKITQLKFKNTQFLTEGQMMSKIPDEYKYEGNRFIMKDKVGNEFLVEWHVDDEPYVLNKTKVNNELGRIKNLFEYKSQEHTTKTTNTLRSNEDKKFSDMLAKARKLMR